MTKNTANRGGLFAGLSKITGYQPPKEPEQEKAGSDAVPPASPRKRNKAGLLTMHDPAVLRQLKTLAAEQGLTQQKLVAEGLNMVFVKYGKPPIASGRD
jgi:hypothetical protein